MAEDKDWNARFELAQKRTRGLRTIAAFFILLLALLFLAMSLIPAGSSDTNGDVEANSYKRQFYVPAAIALTVWAGWLAISDWKRPDSKIPPESSTNK
jgi:hypothetical protein